ncbi:peptidylprolyl isomerase [Leucobacter sp. USHLN153]|uniref:peptidylprolyl isomerase n=1 Tax=Leucobacter sp. USHLN153 TaxID=3081268 RepID=UPI00301944E3
MLRRILPATAAAVLLLAGVTGCSAQEAQAADCSAKMQPGALSDGTKVLGSFGEIPEISVPEDLSISSTQRTVVAEGEKDGRVAVEDSLVGVNMAFFAASGGDALYQSPGFDDPNAMPEMLLVDEDAANPLSEAVRCSVPGDRVVLALSPEDSAQLGAQLGAPTGDTLVGVIDVRTSSALRATDGPVRGLPNGFPAVVTNDEGQPGIVLPPTEAPEGMHSGVRIEGDGKVVQAGDAVIGHVLSVDWNGTIQQNTWDSGVVMIGSQDDIEMSGNTFRTELTGAKVGSQVVIVEHESGGLARVVVVDIVGVN